MLDSAESIDQMQLLAAIIQCFGTIVLGYLAGKIGLISSNEIKPLNVFLFYFSLPCLIFISLAKVQISLIDWYLILSVFLAKFSIFLFVIIVTLIIIKLKNIGKAGLYGIICSQSNDFAIGYPLFVSIYSKSYPYFTNYIYVFALLQCLFINPIGIFMMEMQKLGISRSPFSLMILILLRTIKNPIIIMTLLGLLWNLYLGSELPQILSKLIQSLADAFPSTVLFILGTSIVGQFKKSKLSSDFHVSLTLTAVKLILFPLFLRFLIQNIVSGESSYVSSLSNFGFLYGTIPVAPSVFIFSQQYELSSIVASSILVISTLTSLPIIFVSSSMIGLVNLSESTLKYYLKQYGSVIGIIAFFCGLLTLLSLTFYKKWRSVTHRCSMFLIISQTILAFGGFCSRFDDAVMLFMCQMFSIYGTFSSRILIALLALTMILTQYRSTSYILKLQNLFTSCALFFSIIAFSVNNYSQTSLNTSLYLDYVSPLVLLIILIVSLIFTLLAIILFQRKEFCKQNEVLNEVNFNESNESFHIKKIMSPFINLSCEPSVCNGCKNQRNQTSISIRRYLNRSDEELLELIPINHKIFEHLTLLIFLSISMVTQIAVNINKIIPETFSGIAIEIEFLDIFTNYGQAICSFFLFFDFTIFSKFFKRQFCQVNNKQNICDHFKNIHMTRCDDEICFRIGKFRAFKGYSLINWIIENGIANDRSSAKEYVRHLADSLLIMPLKNDDTFLDSNYLYRFVN